MSLIPAFFSFFFYIPCLFTSLASFWGVFVSLYICFHFFMLSLFVLFSFQGFFPHFYDIFVFLLTHNDFFCTFLVLFFYIFLVLIYVLWLDGSQCSNVEQWEAAACRQSYFTALTAAAPYYVRSHCVAIISLLLTCCVNVTYVVWTQICLHHYTHIWILIFHSWDLWSVAVMLTQLDVCKSVFGFMLEILSFKHLEFRT